MGEWGANGGSRNLNRTVNLTESRSLMSARLFAIVKRHIFDF